MKIGKIFESIVDEESIKNLSIQAFHGSPHEITNFTDEFVGGKDATDQQGPGIYFTTSYDEALAYADNGYVYTVQLSPKLLFGEDESRKTIPMGKLKKLIMMANDWRMNAQNFAQNPIAGLNEFLRSAYDYNDSDKDVLQQVWIDFYRYNGRDFIINCVKVGIDGVIVNRYQKDGKNIIIYNPSVIKVLKKTKV